jgi:hypothetical protein
MEENDFEDDDDEQHASEIRLLIEECQHKIIFLQKSQESLQEAQLEFPDDADFAQALAENSEIIKQKNAKIIKLRDCLLRTDPAYRAERKREATIENRRVSAALIAAMALSNDLDVLPIDEISSRVTELPPTDRSTNSFRTVSATRTAGAQSDSNADGLYL